MTKIDHDYTDEIVCPYCGTEFGDSWETCPNTKKVEVDCDVCGKVFFAEAEFSVTYCTKKKEPPCAD